MENKIVEVKFANNKGGLADAYFFNDTLGCKKYDAVIVQTRYGLALGYVVNSDVDNSKSYFGDITAPVVEKIESNAINNLVKDIKRRDLQLQLDRKAKEMDKMVMYKMYAENDPEFAKMLEEFKSLG